MAEHRQIEKKNRNALRGDERIIENTIVIVKPKRNRYFDLAVNTEYALVRYVHNHPKKKRKKEMESEQND